MRKFYGACAENGVTSADASLRWIMYHSELREGDGIILGATRVEQLVGNIEACKKGPLSNEVLHAAEELWADAKSEIKDLV
jgi:aflatoxin B1 aldehyde reductase